MEQAEISNSMAAPAPVRSSRKTILQRLRSTRLQTRIIVLILAITVPILAAEMLYMSSRAASMIEVESAEKLASTNRALAGNLSIWIDLNTDALNNLAAQPDIKSME